MSEQLLLLQPHTSEQSSELQVRLMWGQCQQPSEQSSQLQDRVMLLLSLTRELLLKLGEHDSDRGAAEPVPIQLSDEPQSLRIPKLPV